MIDFAGLQYGPETNRTTDGYAEDPRYYRGNTGTF